jgi:hypothetical protein
MADHLLSPAAARQLLIFEADQSEVEIVVL